MRETRGVFADPFRGLQVHVVSYSGGIPDLDPEHVLSTASLGLAIRGGDHEPLQSFAADRSVPLELVLRPGDHEPLVLQAVKAEIGHVENERRTGRERHMGGSSSVSRCEV